MPPRTILLGRGFETGSTVPGFGTFYVAGTLGRMNARACRQGARAGVAELVDALDLGSSDESRGGSSPSARTIARMKI